MEKAKISISSRKTSILRPFERADSLLSRMRGLMFRSAPLAILFTFDWNDKHSIHSYFVPFEFDAVYLDEQMRVTDILHSVKPFISLLTPSQPARHLLELPGGDAKKLKAALGDQIKISES